MEKLAIYLDDIRTPIEELPNYKWEVVRSFEQFKKFIIDLYTKEKRIPDFISFDHDLGPLHMNNFLNYPNQPIPYDEIDEMTGLHCAEFLVNFCEENNIDWKDLKTYVHSINVRGAYNIQIFINYHKQNKFGPDFANCYLRKYKYKIENESKDTKT